MILQASALCYEDGHAAATRFFRSKESAKMWCQGHSASIKELVWAEQENGDLTARGDDFCYCVATIQIED